MCSFNFKNHEGYIYMHTYRENYIELCIYDYIYIYVDKKRLIEGIYIFLIKILHLRGVQ